MKRLFIIFGISILFTTCDWIYRPGPCDASGPIVVYKTRGDYHDKISIQLSKDKSKVTCYPGKGDAVHQRPTQLANGYLLKKMCGDTFLSITFDEFINSTQEFTPADFLNLILDSDPYIEKFECCECTGYDTAKINHLIRTNQLSKCKSLR